MIYTTGQLVQIGHVGRRIRVCCTQGGVYKYPPINVGYLTMAYVPYVRFVDPKMSVVAVILLV